MIRCSKNPIITREQICSPNPALKDVSSVFNPGGIMYKGSFLLLLRVQNRARETFLVKAVSDNGIDFNISEQPMPILNLDKCPHTIYHIYDPRISKSEKEEEFNVLCAIDTEKGCYLGLFTTNDFSALQFVSIVSEPDVRNGVLLTGTKYRFERPNRVQGSDFVKTGNVIICSQTEDYISWQPLAEILTGRSHYWDELVGSGPPPLKTKAGWLHLYHGVATHFSSSNIYQAGVSLHDLQKPWICLARGKYNILEPRELYEMVGQVPNVVFPSAAIATNSDENGFVNMNSDVFVYYGAADTSVCLAVTKLKDLIARCYD